MAGGPVKFQKSDGTQKFASLDNLQRPLGSFALKLPQIACTQILCPPFSTAPMP